MNLSKVAAIVLAAGKGTRMKSPLPKTMHEVAGKPMLAWVLDSIYGTGIEDVCVVFGGQMIDFEGFLRTYPRSFRIAEQTERNGTADAVAAAGTCFNGIRMPSYANGRCLRGAPIESEWVLVCAGDVPGIEAELLTEFLLALETSSSELGVIGMDHPDPTGYGRLVQAADGQLTKIVEEKDATEDEKKITLCNTGIIAAKTSVLFELLCNIDNDNSQKEYYLTSCFEAAKRKNISTHVFSSSDWQQFSGINDQSQRLRVEQLIVNRQEQQSDV